MFRRGAKSTSARANRGGFGAKRVDLARIGVDLARIGVLIWHVGRTQVDPETYVVKADGVELLCDPARCPAALPYALKHP
eukprot:1508739-Rhodomonas_salina.1